MSTHADDTPMGPISYLIVEFPGNNMTGEGLAHLVDLSDRGLIRILDLAFVTRGDDGSLVALDLHEIDGGGFDVSIFAGVSSGLLDQSDFDDVGESIEPGCSAGILIFENCWAANFVEAIRRGGAELVSAGYIPIADLVAALDATEPD